MRQQHCHGIMQDAQLRDAQSPCGQLRGAALALSRRGAARRRLQRRQRRDLGGQIAAGVGLQPLSDNLQRV